MRKTSQFNFEKLSPLAEQKMNRTIESNIPGDRASRTEQTQLFINHFSSSSSFFFGVPLGELTIFESKQA